MVRRSISSGGHGITICMRVHLLTHTYIYTHAPIFILLFFYFSIVGIYICRSIYARTFTYTCMHEFESYVSIARDLCIYIYIYIDRHVYIENLYLPYVAKPGFHACMEG